MFNTKTTRNTALFLIKPTYLLATLMLLGSSLPAYALTDMQGKAKQFSDLIGNGRWTVFEVWSSECIACPDAVFYMNNLKKRYKKVDLVGLSVNGDYGKNGRKMAEKFIKKHEIVFPTLYSSSAEVDAFLNDHYETLFGTPSVLMFNPKGELRGIEVGAIISQDVIDFIEGEEEDSGSQ